MSDNKNMLFENFRQVFKENRWGNDESVSGAGSALSSPSVRASVQALDELIRRFGIRSINDVPCGDFYWFPLILGRFPDIEYHGFDIVPDLIDWNRDRYPDRSFDTLDVTSELLPQADMIFCKDLFLHLHDKDIASALANFKLSGSRFLLVSNASGVKNQELVIDELGQCRHVDLVSTPFDLPKPVWSTDYLSLWKLDAIDEAVFYHLRAKLNPAPIITDEVKNDGGEPDALVSADSDDGGKLEALVSGDSEDGRDGSVNTVRDAED